MKAPVSVNLTRHRPAQGSLSTVTYRDPCEGILSTDTIQLRDQVGVLRRRWLTVVVTVLLAIVVGLLVSFLSTPQYEAETEVLLPPAQGTSTLTAEEVATEARTVVLFADEVIDALGLEESTQDLLNTVVVEPDPDGAAVLTITAVRDDAGESADVANAMATAYVDSTDVETASRVDALEKRISALDRQIRALQIELNNSSADQPPVKLASDLRNLRAERGLLVEARAAALREAGLDADQAEVVTLAVTPSSASSPQPIRILAVASALGLLLGIGLAYLRDYFDDSVRDEHQISASSRGRPLLGQIPRWNRSESGARPITMSSPYAPASEAYRELGANIRFLLGVRRQSDRTRREPGRVVLVSSAGAAEGKTATAVNLAVVAAAANLRVVLVDANLRRPRVHELFDEPVGKGLADVLNGGCSVQDTLVDVQAENLLLLPAGDAGSNAAGLLTSPTLTRLLTELRGEADLVVVDSSAVLRVADALELARACDLTVLVARSKMSRGRDLAETIQRIDRVGGSTAGVVLNAVESERGRTRDDRHYVA